MDTLDTIQLLWKDDRYTIEYNLDNNQIKLIYKNAYRERIQAVGITLKIWHVRKFWFKKPLTHYVMKAIYEMYNHKSKIREAQDTAEFTQLVLLEGFDK